MRTKKQCAKECDYKGDIVELGNKVPGIIFEDIAMEGVYEFN